MVMLETYALKLSDSLYYQSHLEFYLKPTLKILKLKWQRFPVKRVVASKKTVRFGRADLLISLNIWKEVENFKIDSKNTT